MIEIKFVVEAAILFAFGFLFLFKSITSRNKMLGPFIGFGILFLVKAIIVVQNLYYMNVYGFWLSLFFLNFVWLMFSIGIGGKK